LQLGIQSKGLIDRMLIKSVFLKNSLLALSLGLIAQLPISAMDAPQLPEDVFPALRQILADAAKQSPRMMARNLELLIADGELVQAKSARYPSVGGSYSKTKTNDVREDVEGTQPTDKQYYSFSISQPLFHWGAVRNTVQIGEIRRQIAEENYGEAYRLLAQEIRSSYLTLILSKIGLQNSAFSRKLADDALVVAEDRLQKKVISEGAIFQTRMSADQARLNQETADWYFQVAKQNFATLTGQAALFDAQIPDRIPGLLASSEAVSAILTQFLAKDKINTATAKIYRQQIEIDDLSYKIHRTRLRPKLSLVAGLTQDEISYTANIAQKYALQSQYVGVSVSWSIFDGFATRGAISSALARKRLSEQNYRDYSSKLSQDAQKAAKSVDLAQRQLAISERLLNNAGNGLAYTNENFKRGQSSEAEVNAAQANFNGLENAANGSRRDYLLRVSEFMSLIGEDTVAVR
jgi:outer membrane protein TolC